MCVCIILDVNNKILIQLLSKERIKELRKLKKNKKKTRKFFILRLQMLFKKHIKIILSIYLSIYLSFLQDLLIYLVLTYMYVSSLMLSLEIMYGTSPC